MIKKRGRPPKFNLSDALDGALEVFWRKGLSATSLDDLAAAMNMNRPSIYNSFGDKESLYRQAMQHFAERMAQQLDHELTTEQPFNNCMERFYSSALDTYFDSSVGQTQDSKKQQPQPLGCFATCTAVAESVEHENIRTDLQQLIQSIDKHLEKRIALAIKHGELASSYSAIQLAKLLHGVLQSLAIRARAGESRASLTRFYRSTLECVCSA